MWNTTESWRSYLVAEIKRKSIHMTGLSVPASLYYAGRTFTMAFVGLALAVSVVLEYLRLKGSIRLPEVRAVEESKVASYFYFILGCLVTVTFFPAGIAITSVLMLCFGDAASAIMGSVLRGSNIRELPRKQRSIKPAPVIAGMLITCAAVGYMSSNITMLSPNVFLAGAIGATVADSVPFYIFGKPLDDNFGIPVISAIFMALAGLI